MPSSGLGTGAATGARLSFGRTRKQGRTTSSPGRASARTTGWFECRGLPSLCKYCNVLVSSSCTKFQEYYVLLKDYFRILLKKILKTFESKKVSNYLGKKILKNFTKDV